MFFLVIHMIDLRVMLTQTDIVTSMTIMIRLFGGNLVSSDNFLPLSVIMAGSSSGVWANRIQTTRARLMDMMTTLAQVRSTSSVILVLSRIEALL